MLEPHIVKVALARQALSLAYLISFSMGQLVWAQQNNPSTMENELNQIDQPGLWSKQQTSPIETPTPTIPSNNSLGTILPSRANVPTLPLFSPENILRVLLGGSIKNGNNANSDSVLGQVQENLQAALDQAAKAEDACGRASHGSDQELRMAAAEEARYAAQAAHEAAEQAESVGHNSSADITDLSKQAWAAADRAQAAADRASANAEGGGW